MFYSVPQTLNPDHNYSIPISPYYHMGFPKGLDSPGGACPPILGLICTMSRQPMIYNPSRGEYISLPRASTKKVDMHASFGYDPIDKLFKVLCVSIDYVCRVSTLGTREVSWRTTECSKPHIPLHAGICINGVLYYLARRAGNINGTPTYYLVIFDVRTESFKFITVDLNIVSSALINFKGKLGVVWTNSDYINEDTKSLNLWVLEDVDEPKWWKSLHILPYYWRYIAADTRLYTVGMTSAGEIVLSTSYIRKPFYMFYYNIVKNAVVIRVEIDFGILAFKASFSGIFTFIDHVENVELMD